MGKVSTKEAAAIARAQTEEAARAILVTTGDVQAKYQPINIVFAVGGSSGGLFTTASPQQAFEAARFQLQLAAVALGGHAVVFCAFAYQAHATQFLGCNSTAFTVSGYGTVVRFV
jgi:uncharacterized protein YbjQ (UPF0145 family)